jgi:arsenate reductase
MKMLRLFGILFFATSTYAQGNEQKTIVFVCEHGGARSTIASVYFNKMARENHRSYHSVFRALTPDSAISKETKNGLIKDGFETASLVPVALTLKDVGNDVMLISLDCTMPSSYHADKSWNGIPAISNDYQAARNTIVKMLEELISELKSKKSTSH